MALILFSTPILIFIHEVSLVGARVLLSAYEVFGAAEIRRGMQRDLRLRVSLGICTDTRTRVRYDLSSQKISSVFRLDGFPV